MARDNVEMILGELGITPEQTLGLTGNQRSRLLNFLLRWEHLGSLSACLDALIPPNPTLVSLLDLRARALLAQNRPGDALEVMQERLRLKTSISARSLLARAHLARGDVEAAHLVARSFVEENPDSAMVWNLLGEIELARGNTDAALAAYRRLNELRPQSRAYLLGMVALYQARGDWVTASGYAVRLLRAAAEGSPLPILYLKRLRDHFQTSEEGTRVADLEAELARRYAEELGELQAALAPTPRPRAPAVVRSDSVEERGERTPASVEFLATFDEVRVSEEERTRIAEACQRLFGFESLLPGQLETIACVLRGEDILVILPTGGGKSLCYQLPALLAGQGTTLVISPLVALMKDQVDSLPREVRSRATNIDGSLDRGERQRRLDHVVGGAYRLVYAAPERLRQPPFLHALRCAGVSRLVIDEAHCVSVWGHDFRPDYLAIGRARRALGDPPLLAMTATAPSRVRRDILNHLDTSEGQTEYSMRIIAGDVTRPNLRFEVFHARNNDQKLHHLLAFCQAEPGSGIIYAGTRARCEKLSALLCQHGIVAGYYHAGISNRAQVQDDFMAGRIRIVVATVAFGLGIDKPDIRFIVHFVPSNSMEAYYQEAGRAGRDGLPSRCLLMYSSSDRARLTRHLRRDVLPVEFLRDVYAAVKCRLGRAVSGRVAGGDLERDLQSDMTRIRVALSLLEEVGLVRRGPDFPRTAVVCLTVDTVPEDMAELSAFCRAARLRPGQSLNLDLADVAHMAGLSLYGIEDKLLAWSDAGLLRYNLAGRDLLLELLPPPEDAKNRVEALLERYTTIQLQRVDEIAAYARTQRCRHGHINAYLGGHPIDRCNACDNCVELSSHADPGLPDEREQLLTVLRCVSEGPWSWGRRSLMRILRGDAKGRHHEQPLHQRACDNACFGALSFRSDQAIERMLDTLESGGFLRARRLDHGGVVLDITPAGQAALRGPAALDRVLSTAQGQEPPKPRSPRRSVKRSSKKDAEGLEVDETLFQILRAWRLEQARAQKIAPFGVLHNRVLRAIAAQYPTTLEALSELKGIGPHKLEKYGQQVIEIVRDYLKREADGSGSRDQGDVD